MGMRPLIWRGQQLLKHCFAHNFSALLCFIYLSNPIDVYAGGVKTDHRFNSVTTRTHVITWCDYEYCILYVCAGWGGHMRKRASLFGWSDKAQSQHCLFALEESIAPGRKSKIPGSLHKKLKEKNKHRLMAYIRQWLWRSRRSSNCVLRATATQLKKQLQRWREKTLNDKGLQT